MGSCFSTDSTLTLPAAPTANVITSDGHLREYALPATVSLVLDQEAASSPSFFLCNSDGLYYDKFIPALDFDDELQPNQVYFILPKSKLERRLSAADMAAMAVKAGSALAFATADPKKTRTCVGFALVLVTKRRVSVSSEKVIGMGLEDDILNPVKTEASGYSNSYNQKAAPKMTKSGSVRRLQRYTSRRAKMAVRSFRLRLSTIYENATVGRD